MPNHLEEVWREQKGEWREREEANVEKVTGANPGGVTGVTGGSLVYVKVIRKTTGVFWAGK